MILKGASPLKFIQGFYARNQKEHFLLRNQINSNFARNILNSHFLMKLFIISGK